jgi:type III secretory pathway component EscR
MLGATILITLTAQAKPTNAAVQNEIAEIFKKNPDKEIIVKVENNQSTEKAAKFEVMPDDSIQDPYDQIKNYVEAENMNYFNQLKTHMETKDSTEQVRCKAVVYAILQDTLLNQEQRQILALGYFERLARMPGSDYRFRLQ